MAQLVAKAKRIGLPPADYAKRLIEDGLALQRQAEKMSFQQIMGPVRHAAGNIDEAEIVKLVEVARSSLRHGNGRGKKK
jgi:hypothetical protein